jgi:superfamily II DNA or RNA helicase
MTDILFQYRNATSCKIIASQHVVMELHARYKFRPEGFQFNPKYKAGIWSGWIELISRDGTCPVGLVPDAMKFAIESGYSCKVSQEFSEFKTKYEFDQKELDLPFELRDYQVTAIQRALDKKRQILLLATSAGKSVVMYALTRIFAGKTLVIVPNVSLISQIESDYKAYSVKNGWSVDDNCTFIFAGQDKNVNKPITISTWQSIYNIKDEKWFQQFDNVIVDEVHLASSASLVSIMQRCTNAFFRIGVSGTLDKSKTNEMSLIANFGPVHRIVSAKQLMDDGHVTKAIVKPIILVYPEKVCKPIRGLPYDDELDVVVKSKSRNQFLVNFANSLEGNSLFLFRFVDKHAEVVKQALIESGTTKVVHIISADTPKDVRENLRKLVEETNDNIIISTYALFSTGVSINNLHHVVFASPTKSSVKVLQSIGRSLRKHDSKALATIWDIVDDYRGKFETKNYLFKHFEERLQCYLSEQFEVSVKEIKIGT